MSVRQPDLRQAKRKRVLMTATIISVDGAQMARVRDLTSCGAGVGCQRPLTAGTDVIFKRNRLLVAARVAWADGNEAGLVLPRSSARRADRKRSAAIVNLRVTKSAFP